MGGEGVGGVSWAAKPLHSHIPVISSSTKCRVRGQSHLGCAIPGTSLLQCVPEPHGVCRWGGCVFDPIRAARAPLPRRLSHAS